MYIYIHTHTHTHTHTVKRTEMYPRCYYQSTNGLMVIHALGHMITLHSVPKCMSYHETIGGLAVTRRAHSFFFLCWT